MRSTTARLATLALVLCCACSEPAGPRWIHLAQGFAPSALAEDLRWSPPGGRGAALELVASEEGSGLWVRQRVELGPWSGRAGGVQTSELPGVIPLRASVGGKNGRRLVARERFYPLFDATDPGLAQRGAQLVAGTARLGEARIELHAGELEPPVGRACIETFLTRGAARDGSWRVDLGAYSGEGIPVLPGTREELQLDLPPASALRFATAGIGLHGSLHPEMLVFRVLLDGVRLFEHEQERATDGSLRWHALVLPPEGRARARLTFEVEGERGLAAFVAPIVGPADVGARGARPFASAREPERPDLVLFVADTFRADNLAAYRGAGGLAPVLDRLFEQGLCFTRARTTCTWTLPAHASMFTGLYPPQHGLIAHNRGMPEELVTLAEHLAANGYRTAAVTDAAWVSARFGLDHGFELFREQRGSLEETLADARRLLVLDDGRPLFLFVHSYRVHAPYEVSSATKDELAEALPLTKPYRAWVTEMQRAGWDPSSQLPVPRDLRHVVRGAYPLYLGAVRDLDRAFGRLLEILDSSALGRAYLVFTSDHGESFLEHGVWGHGGEVYEDTLRIPLLVVGPGIAARKSEVAASLVDLPRTFADLAGLAPAAGWLGRSLLAAERDEPALSFSGQQKKLGAFVVGTRKVVFASLADDPARGALVSAYDLASDPDEHADARAEPWAQELFGALAPRLDVLGREVAGPSAVELDGRTEGALRDLGYLGD